VFYGEPHGLKRYSLLYQDLRLVVPLQLQGSSFFGFVKKGQYDQDAQKALDRLKY
jgi:hypothetical protein